MQEEVSFKICDLAVGKRLRPSIVGFVARWPVAINSHISFINYPLFSEATKFATNMKTTEWIEQNFKTAMTAAPERMIIGLATGAEREEIYRLRHDVYALELGQYGVREERQLRDALDDGNIYIVARSGKEIAGFVSITPPQHGRFSIDKYFARETLPFAIDEQTFEIRLLTVVEAYRSRESASALMYAAFRWVESHGGSRIVAIGRREFTPMYVRAGLKEVGMTTQSGAVTYDLLQTSVADLRKQVEGTMSGLIARLESKLEWDLGFPFQRPASCFHGGAFFEAIGERFQTLGRYHDIINADVLDAWFSPAPGVLESLHADLPWLLRTSPPTACSGFIEAIAEARRVRPQNILPGGGSSDLMFRAFREWLTPQSRALILDPTYGEYAHLLERVIGCTVDRLNLRPEENYEVNLDRLTAALKDDYDLVALVNPNSPTGQFVQRDVLQKIISTAPAHTRVWIDETYIDYVDAAQSLEKFAAASENVIVCKSMSKIYALSGARAAYLCASPHQLEQLRAITPPWVVGLPTQLAAVRALQDREYYEGRYAATRRLREEFARDLQNLGWEVNSGVANFVLCELPQNGPTAAEVVARARELNLFIRNASTMGDRFGNRAIRIAVKDRETNQRMIEILRLVARQ